MGLPLSSQITIFNPELDGNCNGLVITGHMEEFLGEASQLEVIDLHDTGVSGNGRLEVIRVAIKRNFQNKVMLCRNHMITRVI